MMKVNIDVKETQTDNVKLEPLKKQTLKAVIQEGDDNDRKCLKCKNILLKDFCNVVAPNCKRDHPFSCTYKAEFEMNIRWKM